MNSRFLEIQQGALQLPAEEKESLVELLLESLWHSPQDESVRRDWLAEIRRRHQEYKEGREVAIPAEEVMDSLREEFGWQT